MDGGSEEDAEIYWRQMICQREQLKDREKGSLQAQKKVNL